MTEPAFLRVIAPLASTVVEVFVEIVVDPVNNRIVADFIGLTAPSDATATKSVDAPAFTVVGPVILITGGVLKTAGLSSVSKLQESRATVTKTIKHGSNIFFILIGLRFFFQYSQLFQRTPMNL
jgi:hypothetical protein